MKSNIISCEFNHDTAYVDLKLADGSMVSIALLLKPNEIKHQKLSRYMQESFFVSVKRRRVNFCFRKWIVVW